VSSTKEAKAVFAGLDFFVVIKNPCHVVNGFRNLYSQLESHRDTGLHIDAASTPEPTVNLTRGQIVVSRNGVDVTSPDHSLRSAEVSPRCHSVVEAENLEMRDRGENSLNGVRQ
jgi:hypothetical protein